MGTASLSSSESPGGDSQASSWREDYRRYRALEKQFHDQGPSGQGYSHLLEAAAQGSQIFQRTLREYLSVCHGPNPGQLPKPSEDLQRECEAIAALKSSYDTREAGFIFDSVYHLAFDQLSSWRKPGNPIAAASECFWLYRGQRNVNWDMGAKIYRNLPDGPEGRLELQARAAHACRLGRTIGQWAGMSLMEAMAVLQHYSAEEGIEAPTWLADFSRDPWAALFFASDGGRSGDFGVVWSIISSEYDHHTSGRHNPIGPLQLVVPKGIPRINNQAGVFIVAAQPEILHQYVPFGRETSFRQHTGTRFEDPALEITKDKIYPPQDELKLQLVEACKAASACACSTGSEPCNVPEAVFSDPADPITYHTLLRCWLEEFEGGQAASSDHADLQLAMAKLAQFHALLHSPNYAPRLPNIVSRSLNRLHDAFEKLWFMFESHEQVSLRTAINGSYIHQMMGDEIQVRVLKEALNRVAT